MNISPTQFQHSNGEHGQHSEHTSPKSREDSKNSSDVTSALDDKKVEAHKLNVILINQEKPLI
jgi:hypothetical protein